MYESYCKRIGFTKEDIRKEYQKIFNKICYQLMKKVLDSSKFKEQDLFFKEQRKKLQTIKS